MCKQNVIFECFSLCVRACVYDSRGEGIEPVLNTSSQARCHIPDQIEIQPVFSSFFMEERILLVNRKSSVIDNKLPRRIEWRPFRKMKKVLADGRYSNRYPISIGWVIVERG